VKRLTQTEALQQARAEIQAEQVSPKPKRVADDDGSEPRDRERWRPLPKHLAAYAGEQAIISQGHVWTHRVDRRAGWTDSDGVKHYPCRGVYLGPVDALDPNYQHAENKGPGKRAAEGDKTPSFVLGSKASSSDTCRLEADGVLAPLGGRPRKDGHDDLIQQFAQEGLGCRVISRLLRRDGVELSPRTVSRRLEQLRLLVK
jgi:hypothetical protein